MQPIDTDEWIIALKEAKAVVERVMPELADRANAESGGNLHNAQILFAQLLEERMQNDEAFLSAIESRYLAAAMVRHPESDGDPTSAAKLRDAIAELQEAISGPD
jgi:hypothetical protein